MAAIVAPAYRVKGRDLMTDVGKQSARGRILVVDDENGPRQALRMLLKEEHEVHLAADVPAAQAVLKEQPFDLVITDLRMPKQSGVDLLRWTKTECPETEVIILTGYGDLDTAVQAVQFGALAYVVKPFDAKAMLKHVEDGLARRHQELERRRMEELALEANRFQTLGRFVSGMLHDLGTPLSVIAGQLEIVSANVTQGKEAERIHTVQGQVRLCTDIVRTAMNFLRHETQRFSLLNINDVAESCLAVSAPQLQKMSVTPVRSFGADIPICEGDFVLMRQAVLNLITNACQAMENRPEPREVHVRTWREPEHVCVAVADTGPGIPVENRAKVFDTFYTTKGERGTGLGLAAVKNIMRRHNGEVALGESSKGGAEFVLRFPLTR